VSKAGWFRLAVIALLFGALELASGMAWINPVSFIRPSKMAIGAYEILLSGKYAPDIWLTLESIGWTLLLTSITGLIGGVVLFKLPRLRRVLDPLLTSYYAVPIFMFYPLFIVFFGLNRIPLVATGFLFSVVAMMVNVLIGLERVPAVLLKTARVHRMSRFDEIRFITLPASMPYIFTGLKMAVAYATVAVVAGEFILSGAGFGYQIAFAYNNFDNVTMYSLMFLLLLIVGVINMLLSSWEQRLHGRWVGR
jgi:NitT/TauT family transport system permease protein